MYSVTKMSHPNWKLIADRTGLPIATIKEALKEIKDDVQLRLIVRTLSKRTDGRGSRQYEREVPNAEHPATHPMGVDDLDGPGMWDNLYNNYLYNTNQTGDKDNEDR